MNAPEKSPFLEKRGATVTLDRVGFSYGGAPMRFDVVFPAGSITALMGASGSGKTTLLNLVAGFEAPQQGRVLIGDTDVGGLPPAQRPVSMIFQENNLFSHLSVEKNVALGRSPKLDLSASDWRDVEAALARTGLSGKQKRLPAELSGGERQRVALARILLRDRPVLLLDEPFASLDPALRADMVNLLASLHAERGMTVLFVSHHPDDARRLASRVVFLQDGRVGAEGPAPEFFADDGPAAFRTYMGSGSAGEDVPIARKRP